MPGETRRRARTVGGVVLAGAVVVAVIVALAAGLALRPLLADSGTLVQRASPDATKIYDRHGELLFEVLDPRAGRRTRVPLSELPRHLIDAVLAVEDAAFRHHPGVDPRGVARAAWHLVREGHIVSGGSTITQQLARALLMDADERRARTVRRKLREMALALVLSRRFSKDEILELYLNEVYFGQLAYGVEAAAQAYFGKPAREVDLAEAALLAGIIQSPATYNPLVDIDAARARQGVALDLMVKAGFIAPDEADLARREPLHLAAGDGPMQAPHFVVWVRSLLESRYGADAVNGGGLQVVTSLDLDLQHTAEAIVRRRMADLARRVPGKPDYRAGDAALVAIAPETGQVLAMVGSVDYYDARIDGAVNVALARRQPGSAMKPFTYLAAFDTARWGRRRAQPGDAPGRPPLPFTAATVLSDVPTAFVTREGEPYRPQNYDRIWHGPIPLRRALATSSNLVAVKVLDAVGVDALIDTAAALGVTTLGDRDRYGLALTLGGGEVRLLELTGAYAGLANGGRRVTPNPILAVFDAGEWRAVRDDPEQWLGAATVSALPAVSPEAVFLVSDILSDDRARLPAFGEHSVLELGRPAAAKTGTTTDFRDNWTMGYTPDLAAGVWVGNADNAPMAYISGVAGAGPIWHDFMEAAHRALPVRAFGRPDGLVERDICAASGALVTESCRQRGREWFVTGTEPRHPDTAYRAIAIDGETGRAWSTECGGRPVTRVFRLLPPEAEAWGRSVGIAAPPEVDCGGRPVSAVRPVVEISPAGLARPAGQPTGDAMAGPALSLIQPAPNATFALSPHLPAGMQQIELTAAPVVGMRLATITLLVDDVPVAVVRRPPWRASWPLTPGAHEARAIGRQIDGAEMASDPVRFNVLARVPARDTRPEAADGGH